MEAEQASRDVCPGCGCIGRYVGEMPVGGPTVGAGAPNYVEVWSCMAENCDEEWCT